MKALLPCFMAVGMLFCGCGKQIEVPKPTANRAPASKGSNPVEFSTPPPPLPPPSPGKATNEATLPVNSKIDLEFLNDTLRDFIKQENRFPRSLDEFVSTRRAARLPIPPPGKKYVLDTNRKIVVMVNE